MRRRTNIRRMFESNENRNEFPFVKTRGVYLRFGRSPLNLIPPQCGDKMRAHPDPAAVGGVIRVSQGSFVRNYLVYLGDLRSSNRRTAAE